MTTTQLTTDSEQTDSTGPPPATVTASNGSVKLINARELNEELIERWERLRSENPLLSCPHFSAWFVDLVARVRDDCLVAVIYLSDRPVAFLPFHRQQQRLFPIARMINDAHGLVAAAGTKVDWQWLLGELDARCYDYHALFSDSTDLGVTAFGTRRTFLCDLRASELNYADWLEQRNRTIFKQRRKTKKLVRDHGPLRLDYASTDPKKLEHVLELKSQQYARTRIFDIFSVEWIRDLMHHLQSSQTPVEGRLSILYAGEQMVAAHMGLQEGRHLHYWFPVYDPEFSAASPGTALFLEIARGANEYELDRIDFGYGEMPYKWTLNNVIGEAPYGAICQGRLQWQAKRARRAMATRLKAMPGKQFAKRMVRRLHPGFGKYKYQW